MAELEVDVASIGPQITVASKTVEWSGDAHELDLRNVLYLPIPRGFNLNQLDNLLADIPSNLRRRCDLCVVRAHALEADQLASSDRRIAQRASFRLEGRPLALLSLSGDGHRLVDLNAEVRPMLERVDEQLLIGLLRQAELRAVADVPGAYLPPLPGSFHYEAPNGAHYATFLRVGTALQSTDALDALAFWVAPHLRGTDVLLLDSWTNLALALNCLSYNRGRPTRLRKAIHVECVRSYNESPEEVARRLRIAMPLSQRGPRILFLLSVCSTGNLARRLVAACQSAGLRRVRTVALYASPACSPQLPVDVLCTLGRDFERHQQSECPYCRNQTPIVRIDPVTYHLEVSGAVEQTAISIAHAEGARFFLEKYAGHGHLAAHRDQHDSSRHHMIHIDVGRLLEHPIFREKVIDEARKLRGRVQVILCPDHDAAKVLARLVNDVVNVDLVIQDDFRLDELSPAQRDLLKPPKQLLLVDDVVITGARLTGYRNMLREMGMAGVGSQLSVLVGHATYS